MARFGAQDIVAKSVEKVVNEWNRPDVAALLLLRFSLILLKCQVQCMSSFLLLAYPAILTGCWHLSY